VRFVGRLLRVLGAVAIGALLSLTGLAATTPSTQPDDQRVFLGELSLLVRSDPWQLVLLDPDGNAIWTEAPDQTVGFQTIDGARYAAARLASVTHLANGSAQFVAETNPPGAAIVFDVQTLGPRAFRLQLTPDAPRPVASLSGSILAAPDERFVGFGERFDAVDQRGQVVDVWAEERRVANYGSTTYAPVPLLLSSGGHGFALERFERSSFDLAAARSDRWTWQQQVPAASILISYGPTLKELVRRNAELTGLPPLPPMWLFGVWKTAVGGQQQVISEMRRLRELGVPISAVFAYDAVDSDANLGWPSVTFAGREAGKYSDHVSFTDTLHRLGMKALNYFTADFHTNRPNYGEPAAHGFLIKHPDRRTYIHPGFNVAWLDLADPDAVVWWAATWRRALADLGYDGGMLDLGELIPVDSVLGDGSTGLQSHNRYPLLYSRAAWQEASRVRPDGDFALMVRTGALGAQRFQNAQWNGDAVMRWEGPDGLQSMLPAALSFGVSGFPYWHTEVAGYVQADLTREQERELWLRWLQMATWTSLLRDHLGDQQRTPIDAWSDEGTLAAFRQAARVHSSLVPYLYSAAVEASQTGVPIMRYLPLEFQDDPRAWAEEQTYMLGSSFLVAPVVSPGAVSRTLYLPQGRWVDYWRGTLVEGGQEITVPAPLDSASPPVFVRAGALIPLAPEHDTLVPASEPGVRTYGGDLIVRVMPGGTGESRFTLYDGTRLRWTGAMLMVESNPTARTIELRLPDGGNVLQRIEPGSASLVP
jgi:alpha-D-xyloside xylohydrolase